MNSNSSLRAAALLVLVTSAWSTPAAAGLVWKGRDGKAYPSARPCMLANPACLPEHTMVMAPAGVSPNSQRAKPASMVATESDAVAASATIDSSVSVSDSHAQTPTMCMARGGWMHMPPCKPGDVTVRVLD